MLIYMFPGSKECQKGDWKTWHKDLCKAFKEANETDKAMRLDSLATRKEGVLTRVGIHSGLEPDPP